MKLTISITVLSKRILNSSPYWSRNCGRYDSPNYGRYVSVIVRTPFAIRNKLCEFDCFLVPQLPPQLNNLLPGFHYWELKEAQWKLTPANFYKLEIINTTVYQKN